MVNLRIEHTNQVSLDLDGPWKGLSKYLNNELTKQSLKGGII